MLADGGRLPDAQVQPTVELDEIFSVFTPRTRKAFQQSGAEFAKAFSGRRGQALNDALGNLEGTATSGERLLSVLRRPAHRPAPVRAQRQRGAGRAERPPRRAARRDRELQRHVRRAGLARRGAERDHHHPAHLPARVARHPAAGRALHRQLRAGGARAAAGGRRPGADRARRARAGARPEGHLPVAGPADHPLAHGAAGADPHRERRPAAGGRAEPVPGRAEPDPGHAPVQPGPAGRVHHQRHAGHRRRLRRPALQQRGRHLSTRARSPDRHRASRRRPRPGLPAAQLRQPADRDGRLRDHRLHQGRGPAQQLRRRAAQRRARRAAAAEELPALRRRAWWRGRRCTTARSCPRRPRAAPR